MARLGALVCLWTVLLAPAYADEAAPSLLDFELRSLAGPEVHSLQAYAGKPVVLLFFQPECNWCLRQVRSLNELKRECDDGFNAVLVGVRGTRSELRTELRRLKPDFAAYQASPSLLEAIGGVETTPLMLVGDAEGRFVTWMRGFIPEDEFLASLSEAGPMGCS